MRNLHAFVMEKRYNGVWFIKSTYTISTYCLLVHVAPWNCTTFLNEKVQQYHMNFTC